jgi:hypothetical protein
MRQPLFIRIPIGEKFRLFNSQGLQFSFETASFLFSAKQAACTGGVKLIFEH